nr:GNAT family N-acetyltransferase [Lachnospiraceae bacterium]
MKYKILEGAEQFSAEEVAGLLRTTYWADKRPVEQIEKSMRHSACYGIVPEGSDRLVGFARVISDLATMFYLSDVVIDPEYRHRGLGTALLTYIETRPEYAGLRGFLITRDAQGLYEKFGYQIVNGRVMVRDPKE